MKVIYKVVGKNDRFIYKLTEKLSVLELWASPLFSESRVEG